MVRRTSPHKASRPAPDSRRQAVLSAIIEEHLISGETVGSHVVSDKFARATGWSSATIRNVMAELEELGLLQQPHTSAGRIPTDKGYRDYDDNILDSTRLAKTDSRTVESIGVGAEAKATPAPFLVKTSPVLAVLRDNVGIV